MKFVRNLRETRGTKGKRKEPKGSLFSLPATTQKTGCILGVMRDAPHLMFAVPALAGPAFLSPALNVRRATLDVGCSIGELHLLAPTCINLHQVAGKKFGSSRISGNLWRFSHRFLESASPAPYRCLTAPYGCLTGRPHAFQAMFMRVLTGLTGPAPQDGVPSIPIPWFPKLSTRNFCFLGGLRGSRLRKLRVTQGSAPVRGNPHHEPPQRSHFWCCLALFGVVWCYLVLKFIFPKSIFPHLQALLENPRR